VKVTLVVVGRLKAGAERDLFDRYQDRASRAGRQLGLTFDIREIPESAARSAEMRKVEEAQALTAVMPAGAMLVVLDEGGRSLGSRSFAERIATWRDSGVQHLVLAIGGADGLATGLLERAALRLALGEMTWPHQIVRILVAEQLYRAVTILSGHPYHRD